MQVLPLPFERLVRVLGRLPGLGPRSAQRMALHVLTKPEIMGDVLRTMAEAAEQLRICQECGNLGVHEVCHICADSTRENAVLCVVEGVDDIWAIERSGVFRGKYFVLGGVISALSGITPDMVGVPRLLARVQDLGVQEVILALGASVDGQTTSHYIADRLEKMGVVATTLAKGMPVGAEVDYLDEGTLKLALEGRRKL
jgi:recombination protein RecR